MRRALLDVNVLLALLDSDHVSHQRARDWVNAEMTHGWASCAITQNGFIRIISQPRYPNPVSPSEALQRLARASETEHHQFWTCSVSLLSEQVLNRSRLHGHRQVTDAYLLALAVAKGGSLVTFDNSVALSAVPGADQHNLVVL